MSTILVVEDDEHISYLLRFILEREGHQVILATEGRAAAELVDTMPAPALVLLDVMLPFVDGHELVTRVRARPDWAQVPVVMLTSQSHEESIVRALDAGASDYLTKPFQPQELAARIRRYLRPGHAPT